MSVSKLFNLQLSNEQECVIKELGAGLINKVTNYPRLRSEYCCDFYQTGDNREKSSPVKIINHHNVKIEHSQIHPNKKQNKNGLINFGF